MHDRHRAFSIYVRIVETGSLSAAARAMGLSQSAVSQTLKSLEAQFEVRLIDRDTRGMALTEMGRTFYAKAKVALEAMADAEAVVTEASDRLSGRLTVLAPVAFAENYLGAMLLEFQAAHPDVIVDLAVDDRFVEVMTGGFDVAIRFGGITSENLIVRKLGVAERLLVAAPGYLSRAGAPRTPADLIAHPYVKFSYSSTGDVVPLLHRGTRIEVPIRPMFLANNARVLADALVAGHGIGAAQTMNIQHHLRSGALVPILHEWTYESMPIHAVYPSARFLPERVKAFVSLVDERIRKLPGVR